MAVELSLKLKYAIKNAVIMKNNKNLTVFTIDTFPFRAGEGITGAFVLADVL